MPAADDWLKDASYRGLLDDVIENPDDDTPRLVMADWLEEHGDTVAHDRARLIRLQLQRAKLSPHSPEAHASRREEDTLLRRHQAEWLGKLKKITSKATFERGFPDDIVVGVAMFAKNAKVLFNLTPIRRLQILRISQTKLTMNDLAAIDGMKRLRGLSIRNSTLGDEAVAALLTAIQMPHLLELDLTGTDLGPNALQALKKANLPRLQTLLMGSNYQINTISQVIDTVNERALTALDLSACNLDSTEMGLLADWPGLATIKELDLGSGSRLGARAAAQLFSSPHLGYLRHLGLSMTDLGQGGATALGNCERLTHLQSLNLTMALTSRRALSYFLSGAYAHRLEDLDLGMNQLEVSAFGELSLWPGLRSLRSLCLNYNEVTNAGLELLLRSPHLGELTTLLLRDAQLTTGAGTLLGSCPRLNSLVKLEIAFNHLVESDVVAMLDSPHLASLREVEGLPNRLSPAVRERVTRRFQTEGN